MCEMLHQHHPPYEEKSSIVEDDEDKNFRKLQFIQSLLVTGKAFGAVYPTFVDLASEGRVFIRETDLYKVCRKQNKKFHFWLFNDCLIYGGLLDTGKYLFHRKIDLITCTVSAYRSVVYKCALEISGAEKSFIVMASNEYEQMQWMKLILDAISAIRNIHESELNYFDGPFRKLPPTTETTSSPFWNNQDSIEVESVYRPIGNHSSGVKCCAICSEGFSVFNRRYECSNCGISVCLDHSSHEVSPDHQQQGMTMNHYRTCNRCCTVHKYEDSSDEDDEDESDDEDEEEGLNIPAPQVFKPSPPPKPMRVPNAQSSEMCYGGTNPRPLFRTSSFSRSSSATVESPSPPPPPPIPRLASTVPVSATPLTPSRSASTPSTPERNTCVHQPVTPVSSYKQGIQEKNSSPHAVGPPNEVSFQEKLAAMKQKCSVAINRPITPTTPQPVLNNICLGYIATVKEPKLTKEKQEQKEQHEAEQLIKRASLGVYDSFDRMIDMGHPLGAVKQKMMSDGFSGAEIQAYILAMERSQEKMNDTQCKSVSNVYSPQRESADQSQSPLNGSSYTSPSSVKFRSPSTNIESGSTPHVRCASALFIEKMDALNSKTRKPLSWPEAVRDNHAKPNHKITELKKTMDPESTSSQNSPSRSFSLSQSVPAASPGQWQSNSNPHSSSIPLTSVPSISSKQPSSTSVTQAVSEYQSLPNTVGERISLYDLSSTGPVGWNSTKTESLNKTYPPTFRSSENCDESDDALVHSPPRRSASPFTRADPKVSSHQSPKASASASSNVNEVKSTTSSRKSTCEIVDSVSLKSRAPASTLRTSSLSEVKKNIEPGTKESLSNRTTVESSSSTTTVTYTYEYDVDTDEDVDPTCSRSKKSKRKDKPKNSSNFSEKDVRAKMEEDGVSQEDIEDFLKQLMTARRPQKRDQANSSTLYPTSATDTSPGSFPVNANVVEMPEQRESRVAADSGVYSTYDKMRSMKVPDGAVLQKMSRDGLTESEINAYFGGIGNESGSSLHHNSVHIPPPPPPPPPPPAPANHGPPIEIRYSYESVPLKGRQTPALSSNISGKEASSKRKESNDGRTASPARDGLSSMRQNKSRNAEAKSGESKAAISTTVKPAEVEVAKKKENPVSRLFASIRSGVALKPKGSKECDNTMTSPPKKNPISLHGMLANALESRRQSSNLEKSENCPSVESVVDFDPDMG